MPHNPHAVNIRFVPGNIERLDEYIAIFEKSDLFDRYFKEDIELKKRLFAPVDSGNTIIAETESGEAVGFMLFDMNGMYGRLPYLALLGVKDGYRNMGIGEQLIDLYLTIGRKIGYDRFFISASDFNPRAKALYQRKGFRPLCLVPALFHEGINEWLMIKEY
ncbi:MAG: GNAT family N-acetyltransferase [Firmicutes bacterium]|nr:GNAT family N-acetyltransferase [Bacillota bacterium]